MHFHWIFLRTSLYCGRINSIFIISFIYISLSSRQQNLDVVPTMKMKTLVNTNNSSTIKKTKTDNTQKNYYVFSIMNRVSSFLTPVVLMNNSLQTFLLVEQKLYLPAISMLYRSSQEEFLFYHLFDIVGGDKYLARKQTR